MGVVLSMELFHCQYLTMAGLVPLVRLLGVVDQLDSSPVPTQTVPWQIDQLEFPMLMIYWIHLVNLLFHIVLDHNQVDDPIDLIIH